MVNILEWSKVTADAINAMQFDSGMILLDFDPTDPEIPEDDDDIIATTGDITLSFDGEIVDLMEDVNNSHVKVAEAQYLKTRTIKLAFTPLSMTLDALSMWLAAADVSGTKITPRAYLKMEDFKSLWWVGVTLGGGLVAINLKNALNTGSMSIKTSKDGKGTIENISMEAFATASTQNAIPADIYVIEPADTTLATLTIGSVTLSPTFSSSVTNYTATTTSSTNTITATATDSANATVVIKNGTTTVNSGSSATWAAGTNTVKITVTNGSMSRVYTVTVTKS